MIETLDKSDRPDLHGFPSAQAQNGAPVAGSVVPPKRRLGMLRFAARFCLFLIFILAAGAAGLYFVLSQGPVSSDQLRASIETQLSTFLGDNHAARVAEARLAFDEDGLLAIDARDIKVLDRNGTNLGVAGSVGVKLSALSLLQGKLETRSIRLDRGAISIDPFLSVDLGKESDSWPTFVDLKDGVARFGAAFEKLAVSLDAAHLEGLTLENTKLIGFEKLDLKSRTASIESFKIIRKGNETRDIFFEGSVATENGNWEINGTWRYNDDGSRGLQFDLSGMDFGEFFQVEPSGQQAAAYMDSPFSVSLRVPFDADGTPLQSTARVEIGDGRFELGSDHLARLASAQINLRFLPEKNQIELERSPVSFQDSTAILIGGLRYPSDEAGDEKPLFELIANDVVARGMFADQPPALANAQITGEIDVGAKAFDAERILIKSHSGAVYGRGRVGLKGETPSLMLDLKSDSISVSDFKQLWPQALATQARLWTRDGIVGGRVRNAWVKADIPPGILGRINDGQRLLNSHLVAEVPIEETVLKTYRDIPPIRNATGLIRYEGMDTNISVAGGTVALPDKLSLQVAPSTVAIGDHSLPEMPFSLTLSLSGSAAALAELGRADALGFTEALDIRPGDISGNAKADITSEFRLDDQGKVSRVEWAANVKLSDAASRKPLLGRAFSNANLTIKAEPGIAHISGSANVDGVPAKVAFVEQYGRGGDASKREITLVLDDADRKRVGIDTAGVISGPVEVNVSVEKDGDQVVAVNLKRAKISLPWLGWSKGSGIAARADFILSRSNGQSRLRNLVLKGKGFSADGRLLLDKSGLASAEFTRVVLSKSDNFSVKAERIKGGFDIRFDAKSYDGRALIRSFFDNTARKSAGDSTVRLSGRVDRLSGFGKQSLSGVTIDYSQRGGQITRALVKAVAAGGAPTVFRLEPQQGGVLTEISTANAGAVLRFLDIYGKIRGGSITANLVRDQDQVFRGTVIAENFNLLNEPRLGKLLAPARAAAVNNQSARELDGAATTGTIPKSDPKNVRIERLTTLISKGPGFLNIRKGRVQGGDAAAAFEGTVYDGNGRMNIKGTYLPARGLNRVVAKIPLVSQILGRGKTKGIFGVTFLLRGPYRNPAIVLNPISLIAPGVFRKLFEF